MKTHAITAGLGAPARLCPLSNPRPIGDPAGLTNQKKQAAGRLSTTAAVTNQHRDFASLMQPVPMAGGVRHE